MTTLLVLLGTCLSLVIWLKYHRYQKKITHAKKTLLRGVEKLITINHFMHDHEGYPQLLGQFNHSSVALRLEVSKQNSHQPPTLWLHITLLRPYAAQGSLDILVRPDPSDLFSPSGNWKKNITPLKSWPEHARYRSQGRVPMLESLDSDICTIFADQRAKELLITPESIRFTYLARKFHRCNYLRLMASEFDMQPIDPAEIAAYIRQLQKLQWNLDAVLSDKAA